MPPAKKDKLPVLRDKYDHRTKYDWVAARTEYIEGYEDSDGTIVYPGPKEVSERFGIPYGNVTTFISKERWKDHRDAHLNQIALARQKEHAKILAKKAVKFDEQSAEASMVGQELILNRLLELKELRELDRVRLEALKDRMLQGEIVPVTEFKSILYHAELVALADSLGKFQDVGRKALGIKDDETSVTQHVEINQTNISTEMARVDQNRAEGILQLLANKNLKLPELQALRDAQNQEVIEAEMVTDGSEYDEEDD